MLKTFVVYGLFISIVFAHGGRTDSNGGHYNRKTGEYHYHGSYSSPKYKVIKKEKYACGAKKYCYEMTSCKEVMYYFNQCALSRLDGDKDGIPCEKLCR